MPHLTSSAALPSRAVKSIALSFGIAIAALCAAPQAAHANLFGDLIGRAVESEVTKRVGDRLKGAAPAPVALPKAGSFAPCQNLFPSGAALAPETVDQRWKPVALCSNHFAVLYSGLTKTPLVVVERLSQSQLNDARNEQRTNEFFADPRVPMRARAGLEDYRGSGYDRGHMAAAANQPDQAAMAQSFALTNMVPQDPVNNREPWAKIESDVRKFARRAQGDVFVFTGPLFRGEPRTIGRGNVWVPTHLFKLVHDSATGRSWGYVLENSATARIQRPLDYQQFVQMTGWKFLG